MGYIFGGDTNLSQEQIARDREMSNALMERFGQRGTPSNGWEGLNAIGQALMYNILNSRAAKGEKANSFAAGNAFERLMQGYGQGGGQAMPQAMPVAGEQEAMPPLAAAAQGGGSPGASADLMPLRGGGEGGGSQGASGGVIAALLNTIAGTESAGKYNVMYGGKRFTDYSDHPRRAFDIGSGPNRGKKSTAAGKYQFLSRTWDQYRDKLGLKDFSPKSQDAAAWALASDAYRQRTGGDLAKALSSGDARQIAQAGKALSGTWTSLPGGIEQGIGGNAFVNAFRRNLGSGSMQGFKSSWVFRECRPSHFRNAPQWA
jgi:muramidase (phage lysozyme)